MGRPACSSHASAHTRLSDHLAEALTDTATFYEEADHWGRGEGVTIGKYALIGSGAVVTKDIPDFSLVIGNPGRVVGKVDKIGNRVE